MQKVLLSCLILNQTPRSDATVNTALSLPIVFLSDTVWDNTVNTGHVYRPASRHSKEKAEGKAVGHQRSKRDADGLRISKCQCSGNQSSKQQQFLCRTRWHMLQPRYSGGRGRQTPLSSRPPWSIQQLSGQPGIHSNTLPPKNSVCVGGVILETKVLKKKMSVCKIQLNAK